MSGICSPYSELSKRKCKCSFMPCILLGRLTLSVLRSVIDALPFEDINALIQSYRVRFCCIILWLQAIDIVCAVLVHIPISLTATGQSVSSTPGWMIKRRPSISQSVACRLVWENANWLHGPRTNRQSLFSPSTGLSSSTCGMETKALESLALWI